MNKNRLLLIVLGVLILVYLGNKFIGSDNERNFKEVLIELDTATVSKVVVMAKANNGSAVSITKEGTDWSVTNGTVSDKADMNMAKNMVVSLRKLEPQRLVANSSEKWEQYEVTDSLGTRVQLFNGEELLTDIIIGKFTFNLQARTAATFVRLTDEEEVYSVDGFLSSTYNQEFNSFRDKTFVETVPENLTSLKFDYSGDSSFVLNKVADAWQVNGIAADSTAVAQYLNGLRRLDQRQFEDGFTTSETPTYTLTLDGNNMSSVVVRGFMKGEEVILNSSLNSDAYFQMGSLNVFDKLFVSAGKFLTEVEE